MAVVVFVLLAQLLYEPCSVVATVILLHLLLARLVPGCCGADGELLVLEAEIGHVVAVAVILQKNLGTISLTMMLYRYISSVVENPLITADS